MKLDWAQSESSLTWAALGCNEGNMDLKTCESGGGPEPEWRQTLRGHEGWSLLQEDTWSHLYACVQAYVCIVWRTECHSLSLSLSLWTEAMRSSEAVVILGVSVTLVLACFYTSFFYSPVNLFLNPNQIINGVLETCFVSLCVMKRRSEHLGGRHCLVSGCWLPRHCETPLIYSKHEISDCDRRCCQNIKHALEGGGGWGLGV